MIQFRGMEAGQKCDADNVKLNYVLQLVLLISGLSLQASRCV